MYNVTSEKAIAGFFFDETKVIASIHVLYNKTLSTHYNTEKIFCFKLMILKNENVLNIL